MTRNWYIEQSGKFGSACVGYLRRALSDQYINEQVLDAVMESAYQYALISAHFARVAEELKPVSQAELFDEFGFPLDPSASQR